MDVYEQYRNNRRGFNPFIAICIILSLIFLAICSTGCRSMKSVEKINWIDSIRYHDVYDTTRVTIYDSAHYEQHTTTTTENGTEITFGAGGGTYNSKTGEATNVTGVKESAKINEQSDIIADLTHRVDSLNARNEKLSEQVRSYESEKQEEKVGRSSYDRFCSWWFWITAILLVIKIVAWVCEKIPVTAPYIIMIRRFIPFL